MRKLGYWLLLIFVVFWGVRGEGAKYYVSLSGNDGNPGTESQPWKTIQKAANTLVAGDTVYIKTGTYYERVIPQNSGTSGKYITYTVFGNDTVIIDGSFISLPDDWGGLFDISGVQNIKLSGLQIRNAGPHQNNTGILVDESRNIIIENNITYNTTSSGIGVWNSDQIILDNNEVILACNDGEQECISVAVTSDFEVKNNHVHKGGPGSIGGEGITLKDGSSNGKAYGNWVHDLNRLGIYIDAWDKHTYNIDVYNNVVYDINDNDCYTLASESGGLLEDIKIYNNIGYGADICGLTVSRNGYPVSHPMKDIYIINNTFYNNGLSSWGGGIAVDNSDIQNVVIRNNILSENRTFQIEVEKDVSMSAITVDHNLIHGYRGYGDEVKGDDFIEGDPLFINASGANFHLQQNSPAIDNGSATNAPNKDFDGNNRPQGNGIDIGAYEYVTQTNTEPEISLSLSQIGFSAFFGVTTTLIQSFNINNSGSGALVWSVTDNVDWLTVNPTSGTGSGSVTVTATISGLGVGLYTGTITVGSSNATNSPQTISVQLNIQSSGGDQEPFGHFDSPSNGSTVRSSVPVTGWALDDTAVERVKIYRDSLNWEEEDWIYIGEAVFIEGARPDVEAQYPNYPNSSRAGWGYMLLTNFLPNQGNGTFTLIAVAEDNTGHEITLGSKTIFCDNENAVKPFGAIDTPNQGGTASGGGFVNWGWVLTPTPNWIPINGSTINVYVDSVLMGNPTYNLYREDIASLFPGYANSNGSVGYFSLDTTEYANGVHTIYWTAMDSAGNTDGIGSRYFSIQNFGNDVLITQTKDGSSHKNSISKVDAVFLFEVEKETAQFLGNAIMNPQPIKFKRGLRKNALKIVYPSSDGIIRLKIHELESIVIYLSDENLGKKAIVPNDIMNNCSHKLWSPKGKYYIETDRGLNVTPIGSSFDAEKGIFYWIPGPGFLGEFPISFYIKEKINLYSELKVIITIVPKY